MKRILPVCIALIICTFTYAQETKLDTTEYRTGKTGKPFFAAFRNDKHPNQRLRNANAFLRDFLKASPEDDLRLVSSTTDEIGVSHHLYQHYYKGIIVDGSTFFVHGKNNNISFLNGEYEDIKMPGTNPRLSENQALQAALRYAPAKVYRWQDSAFERLVRQQNNDPRATNYPSGRLVICKPTLDTTIAWALSWKFTITAVSPTFALDIFVDAGTGKILKATSLICTGNVNGTAQTRYSGTQNIVGDANGASYRLRETRNGVQITTLNMNHNIYPSYGSAFDFADNDNNWTTAEHPADDIALDVHWACENILDYWRNVRGRNSLNNAGIAIQNYVHYSTGYNNAFWDETLHNMSYGDGDGILFRPFTSLDVCAHELGHGICQYTCHLDHQGEPGALNEGFSDIWSAVIENYAAPNKQRWLEGEDFTMPPFIAGRSMSNPKDPNVVFQCPNTYGGALWANTANPNQNNDEGGVHTNMGVLTHWFYLLSDGGASTNDLGHAFCVSGIGITDAASIAWRTETTLTTSANYASTRSVSIQAATDLFGASSQQVRSVTEAWYGVGVGGSASTWVGQCSQGQVDCSTVNFVAPFASANYNWSLGGDLTVNGSQSFTTTSAGITATGTLGGVYVTGSEPGCAGTVLQANAGYEPFRSTINFDVPLPVIGHSQFFAVHIDPIYQAYSYLWYVNGTLVGQTSDPSFHNTNGQDFCSDGTDGNTISVNVLTYCGEFDDVAEDRFDWTCNYFAAANTAGGRSANHLQVADSLAAFQVYPNPANDQVTVALPTGGQPSAIRLMTLTGTVLQELRSGNGQVRITTSALPAGVYMIQITSAGTQTVRKIVVQR